MDFSLDLPKEPDFLKQLGLKEMEELAQKIRQRILSVLSATGGHLASNLGTVELTLALHTVFESPKDLFIFDVSHQTYTHKLLTGRNNEQFDKIRQSNGLCGFAHPKESPHDHFFAGHAGTSLSLALGAAKERDLRGGHEHVIPIIGDATLTCGLSLEALNNLKRDLKRFVVILNDNAMSISENVGGITNILSRLLSNPRTSKWLHELETLLAKIPVYGNSLAKKGWKFAESIKNLVSNAPFFEQFGLSYIGPIDGHDLKKLIAVLHAVKELPMPVIIHAITKKGYGVKQAENDPITYHGVKPFDLETCEFLPSKNKNPTFPKVFGKHLLSLAEKDPSLITVTPAMSLGSCLDSLMKKFPERCIDVGIAEGHAVTFCAGLAKSGKSRVVCSIYSTFLQRALDNVFHDICLQKLPVVFAIDRSGIAFGDGPTHHGIYDMSFLRTMPNMIICQPRNGQLLKELLSSSFKWDAPTSIRYPNLETEDACQPLKHREVGKGEWLAEGEDVLILSLGHLYNRAFEVKKLLLEKGISAAIIDPIFVKPLDKELLSYALMHFQKVVTLEEHSIKGGLGAEMNEFIVSYSFTSVQVLNIGIPDHFIEHGNQAILLDQLELSSTKITQKIISFFSFQSHQTSGAAR